MSDDVIQEVRAYIRERNRYVSFPELCRVFGKTRIFFTYRGVNITVLNAEFGFKRRPPKVYRRPTNISKEDAISIIEGAIISEGRYVSASEIYRKKKLLSEFVVRGLGIDIHSLNVNLGYIKHSPMTKIDAHKLYSDISGYINTSSSWVHQLELCKVFGISQSYLTKSGIDTVGLNYDAGHVYSSSYFESCVLSALRSMYTAEIVLQKTFSDLTSDSGHRLRFDFYLPDIRVCIEADGPQHNDPSNVYYSDKLVRHDALKEEYCTSNGYTLIRIPYPVRGRIQLSLIHHILLESLGKFLTTAGSEKADAIVQKEEGQVISS